MNFKEIKENIIILKNYNKTEREFNSALQYLKTLNFKSYEDKVNFIYLLLDLLFDYKNYDLFKELIINIYHFNNIFNIFNLSNYEIEYFKYNNYNNCLNLKYEKIFDLKNNLIYDEINKINNIEIKYEMLKFRIINNNKFINEYDTYEIYTEKHDINKIYKKIINLFNNHLVISEPFIINDNNFEKYQEYFKSAIIFLINNVHFMNEKDNKFERDITENIKYSSKFVSKDYQNFINLHIDNIINEYTQDKEKLYSYLKTKDYIEIRNILNKYLNNKYSFCIPSFNLYPYYVIQDILFFF